MVVEPTLPPVPQWRLILPLKGGLAAKSRLGAAPALARAIAMDCLEAVLACPDVARVTVVTADRSTAAEAGAAGAAVIAERRPGAGLVAAVLDGLEAAQHEDAGPRGRPGPPVAVLLGDLPALRPVDLSAGLRAAADTLTVHADAPMAALADADGSGTVLLAGRRPGDLDPAFGPGSLVEHQRRGAALIELERHLAALVPAGLFPAAARLRRDVDTPADLRLALAHGVGRRTAALLASEGSGSRPPDYPGAMQATVHSFDPTSHHGVVVTDDGVLVPLGPEAFEESALRTLRAGQRLIVTIDGVGRQARVTRLGIESVGVVPDRPSGP